MLKAMRPAGAAPADKEAGPKPKRDREADKILIKRIAGLFWEHKGLCLMTLVAVAFAVAAGLMPPFFLREIIDHGILGMNLQVIIKFTVFTLLAVLAGASLTLLYGYWGVLIGQKIMCDLRQRLFDHLQNMSLRFFTGTRTGDIQTRLISDVQGVQTVVSNTLIDQISNIAIAISTLIVMIILDWRLTLLSVAMLPIFALIGRWVGDYARDVRKGTQEQTGELNSMMQETLSVSGILLNKTVGQKGPLSTRFDKENNLLAEWQIKAAVLQYMFFGMIRLITQLAPTLVYWLAGWLLISKGDKSITVGLLTAFTGLQIRLFFPLTGIFGAMVEIFGSLALFGRIFEYLDMPLDIKDAPDAKNLPVSESNGLVEFKDVVFQYDYESEDPTLDHVSFRAEPGQLVALVGPSGAGKTTLTYLIPRLYDADSGVVEIDGIDIKKIKLDDLNTLVGAVTQETYLMHTTIKENLRVAKPEATDEELVEACKNAAIYDHIMTLEHGLDTVVGERGYKLSGGEKQRLAIARAILKNPRILILDEATSALDTRSERIIQNSLETLMKGRTTFAIAHRLSTILGADQILVLDHGKIVEMGRHEELLAKKGLYAKLYNEQFTKNADHESGEKSLDAPGGEPVPAT